jgi:RND family efflux transporter MFP subunit
MRALRHYRVGIALVGLLVVVGMLVAYRLSGYVARKNLDQGAAVSAQSSGTNTSSLGILVIHDIASVKVQVEVPERHIARVKAGTPVRLRVGPYTNQVFSGVVARIVHNLDPRTRTMGLEVDIPNGDGRLKPGMFARVDLLVETRKGALTTPVDALRIGKAKPTVMVVRAGVAEAVPIAVGLADGERVEVVSGLADGDQVATVFTLILIPTLYVILEERFPREAPAPEGALTPQGEIA